ARAYPSAGVRGGAASPAAVTAGPWATVAAAGQRVVDGLMRLRPRAPLPAEAPREEGAPRVSGYAVRLGPFAEFGAAAGARARVRGSWPSAAVMADGHRYYVQVTACANR